MTSLPVKGSDTAKDRPATMVDRILHIRDIAAATGDKGLARDCDEKLARLGYRADQPASKVRAAEAADAEAVPAGRGTIRRARD